MIEARVDRLDVRAFTVPTEEPEADGTLTWEATTVVVAQPWVGEVRGIGFTYGSAACAALIAELLAGLVIGSDALDVACTWARMVAAVRNAGRPGVASTAIAAVDIALWDLKARLLDLPLARLLGMARDSVPVYGSGGFTSYRDEELADQLGGWVHELGIPRVKMKIGTERGADPDRDVERIGRARAAIGPSAALYVDANGAYSAKEAVRLGRRIGGLGVTWFEEPVSSDDLAGLGQVRGLVEAEVAAGEYGYDLAYFERMCAAGAVDVLQADVSRCGGITDWLRAAAVAAAHGLEISGHCAQSLHLHPACSVPNLRHLEYFHDHARVDRLLFDGVAEPRDGTLRPDLSRAGIGLELKEADAERWRV